MTKKEQVYKCNICGNIVEVLHEGKGELVCCGQPMEVQEERTKDPNVGEKHVPFVEKGEKKIKVKVGAVEHPMEETHYIEWIELVYPDRIYRRYLTPEDSPEAEFPLRGMDFQVRAYCNVHGLWKSG